MSSVIPKGATWIKARVASFQPEQDQVTTDHGRAIRYRALIVAPANMLYWDSIDGLSATLGRYGVTSNYSFATTPYTSRLLRELRERIALFTQPPMPSTCAGAPQNTIYRPLNAGTERGIHDG